MLNKYFERLFYINLDARKDRNEQFVAHMKESRIEGFERISGVDGKTLELFKNPLNLPHFSAGDVGCTLSHLSVVKKAKGESAASYVVFEDDVLLRRGFPQLFNYFWQQVPGDWDIVYFGANHNNTNPPKVADSIVRVNGSYTTHAMAVKLTAYDEMIRVWSNPVKNVDVLLSELHSKLNCYCFSPNLAGQRAGYSDILNKDVNYDFLLK